MRLTGGRADGARRTAHAAGAPVYSPVVAEPQDPPGYAEGSQDVGGTGLPAGESAAGPEGAPPAVPVTGQPGPDVDAALAAALGPAPTLAARVTSLAEVLFCSGVPTQLTIALLLQGLGWAPLHQDGSLSLRYVATVSLVDAVVIVALALVFLSSRGEAPARVFFGGRRTWRETALGLSLVVPIGLVVGMLGLLLRWWWPWLRNVPDNPLASLMRDPLDAAVFALVAVVAGGVREEVQRAFVLHRFEQHLGGAMVGLIVFSAAFGLGHLVQGYDAALLTGALGFLWGALYLARRSIVAPMVSHAGFNLLEVLKQVFFPA